MNASALRVATYRLSTTFRALRGGYLAVVVLVGLIGGVAMGAVAAARRTQSAFPTYVASTNPSDVQMFTEFDPITGTGYSAHIDAAIARLPHVRHAVDIIGFDGTLQPVGPSGGAFATGAPGEAPPSFEGSPNGDFLDQDRVTVLRGRLWVPTRQDEIVMSAGAAADYGLRLGSTLALQFFTDAQANTVLGNPNATSFPSPYLTVRLKLVGIAEQDFQVVQDDDSALGNQFALFSPALTRRLETCCAYYSYVGLQTAGTAAQRAGVVSAVDRLLPNLGQAGGSQTNAPGIAKAERAVRPESITWGVFGLIAALAALVIAGQAMGRIIRRHMDDRAALRAMGGGPSMTVLDALLGPLLAVVAGALVAVGIAIALSPLAPTGSVRAVYPDPGVSIDWTVLGFGFLVLVLVLGSAGALSAWRTSPHRVARRAAREAGHAGSGRLAGLGLPLVSLLGIRSALGFGTDRAGAPVRAALLGTVLAVVLVVTSVVFGASLNALVSRPALYGWNWNYALLSGFSGAEDLPAAQTASLLRHDPDVAHFTAAYFVHASIDGQGVPLLALPPKAVIHPPVLSGDTLDAKDEIVLGPATLGALHKHVGQTVSLATGRHGGRSITLRIVGTATLPTIGGSGSPDLQMGTGAVVATSLLPPPALNPQGSPVAGPNAELIDVRPGVPRAHALASLNRITAVLNRSADPDGPIGGVVSDLRPAEIANYRAVGSLPFVLAGVIAGAAILALGLTLVASVRRRRHEFALLKAVGLSQGQIMSTVAWQATASAVLGCVIGVPAGIVVGRWLWSSFAHGIFAVPHPAVPVLSVVLVTAGALVFANVVAAAPGRIAARTPTATLFTEQ